MVAWNENYVIETVHGVRQSVSMAAIRWTQDGSSPSSEPALDQACRGSMTGGASVASGTDRLLKPDTSTSS